MSYEEKAKAAPPKRAHDVSMKSRRRLLLSGVEEVESFDEHEIVMQTTEGSLTLHGEGLCVGELSTETGELSVEGLVTELRYEDTAPRGGFWARLFH